MLEHKHDDKTAVIKSKGWQWHLPCPCCEDLV